MRRALLATLAAALLGGPTLDAAAQDRIAFRHFHGGEPVGVTVIEFDANRRTATERTAIERDFAYRPMGTWTAARSSVDDDGTITEFALAAVKAGEYVDRAGRVGEDSARGRNAIVRSRRFSVRHDRPVELKRRLGLSKDRPLVAFDLNYLTPLVQFCRRRGWEATFDRLRRAALIELLSIGADGRLEVRPGFWLERTKERLPIENRAIPTIVFGLRGEDGDAVLVSVSEGEGELLKIEMPSVGYEVRRTFAPVEPPTPVGATLDALFGGMTRLVDQRSLGLGLADRDQLAEVVYSVDLPSAGGAPTRPWQRFAPTARGGIRGTFRVTQGGAPIEGPPPTTPPTEPQQPTPGIDAFAAELLRTHPDAAARIRAVEAHVAGLPLCYNLADPAIVHRQGIGNVTGKTRLATRLLEAGGLRTRTVSGVVYTGDAFVLHRWLECHDGANAWHAIDPTVGSISPLHLTLGTPWVPEPNAPMRIRVASFRFTERADPDQRRLRWPDGEERFYAIYREDATDGAPRTLYGYVRTAGERERYDGRACIRFNTDLLLDNTKLGASGLHEFRALNVVDAEGLPVRFAIQWWGEAKRQQFSARIIGSGAILTESGRDRVELSLEAGTILAAESFWDHWAVYFASIDPRAAPRRALFVLRPAHRKVFRWNLVRREPARIPIDGQDDPVDAIVLDLVEPNIRFWVSPAGVLLRAHDRANGVTAELTDRVRIQAAFGLAGR